MINIQLKFSASISDTKHEAEIHLARGNLTGDKNGWLVDADKILLVKDELLKQALEAISLLQEETGIEEHDLEAIEATLTSDEEDEFATDNDTSDEETEDNIIDETEVDSVHISYISTVVISFNSNISIFFVFFVFVLVVNRIGKRFARRIYAATNGNRRRRRRNGMVG